MLCLHGEQIMSKRNSVCDGEGSGQGVRLLHFDSEQICQS